MSWSEILEHEFSQDYFNNIINTLKTESIIYPPKNRIFTAFELCDLNKVKVVILSMDPYHNPGQAHGLAFSVNKNIKIPPSLKNIFKEIKNDLGIEPPNHGSLIDWAKQGILLLNTALTVRQNEPGSHIQLWEPFTKNIIRILNELDQPIVFLLWGNFARKKRYLITNPKHLILEAAHPSPLSAHNGFFGCRHFSITNEFLEKNQLLPITWKINNICINI